MGFQRVEHIWARAHTHTHTHVYTYTVEFYSAIKKKKKNDILPFSAPGIDLNGILLSEISQTEKDKYCMMSFIWRI